MPEPFDPRKLTWAALLGRWIDFARSAIALPDSLAPWKQIIVDIITLQAITMALREVHDLQPDQQALALDRSRILFDKHTDHIRHVFNSQPLHPMLTELQHDAQTAIAALETRLAQP